MQGSIRFVLGLLFVFVGAGTSDADGPLLAALFMYILGISFMAWGALAMNDHND